MVNADLAKISINPGTTIMNALKQMDSQGRRLLLVFTKTKFKGVLSIGDIQRAIIHNIPLESKIGSIMRKNITVAKDNESDELIKNKMLESRIEFIPVLNSNNELVNVLFWEDFFKSKIQLNHKSIKLPVIIMAGGQGTRLRPLTKSIPKPLLPFGQSIIIETIIENFKHNGSKDFFLSIFYKGQMIKDYIKEHKENFKDLNITFIEEPKPLGSAGSLYMLRNVIHSTIWISNCDIIIIEDYSLIYDYHKNSGNDITIVAAIKQVNIPYGVVESGGNGIISSYTEKPDISLKINSGMYLMESAVLDRIPKNKFYSFSDLINESKGKIRIGIFPVSENSWKDLGSIDKYNSVINKTET